MRYPLFAAALALSAAPTAHAETLRQALASAYMTNPELAANRANVRALDEGVAQAEALKRPTLSVTAGITENVNRGLGNFSNGYHSFTGGVNGNLPLFRGGLIKNSIRAADSRVDAGRYDLAALENDVLTRATVAYEDTRQNAEVVRLDRNQVRVLQEQQRQARDRFEVGDLTRTDVAQSEARLATAQSTLRQAQATLVSSEQAYARVIGHAPVDLQPPPPLGEIPAISSQSVSLALNNNPNLLAARATEGATRYDIGTARAARRPTLAATGGVNYLNYLGTANAAAGVSSTNLAPGFNLANDQTAQSVGLTITIPLFQGGLISSRVRQAQALRSQAGANITATERQVTELARNAFEGLIASRAVIVSAESAVRANELALEGVRAENGVGLRTIIEVLNAEQELLNSRADLVRARRNEYVAGFNLLAALGRANVEDLAIEVARYDPTVNARRVRGIWRDWQTDRVERQDAFTLPPKQSANAAPLGAPGTATQPPAPVPTTTKP